jgi:protein-tyrosine kinase
MALFDKPFRYVPQTETPDAAPGADVAVVDSVPQDVDVAVPEAPPAPPVAGVTGPVARPAVEAPTAAGPEAPLAAPPQTAVQIAAVDAPPPVPSQTSIMTAVPVSERAAELVARPDGALRFAGDSSALTVFSRVVPATPNPSSPRDTQRLVTAIDEGDPVLDQLRSLAASLYQARTGRELKVIAVTSSVSGEGKTLLAANIALTLSRSYMRQVLLIDADLRRPSLHRLFGIPSQDGIRTALESVVEGSPVLVQEVAPRLALLPGGKPVRDPISVLASDAMQRLMTAAMATYDWVVVDTPPVGMLPDMSLLSSLSDAVLLVVEAGRVRYDLVQRTVETIGADRIFGVVLNKVPEHEIVATYGHHYYAPYR